MKIKLFNNSLELGKAAAVEVASLLCDNIASKGKVRLLLSTGASQLETLRSLVQMDVDWSKVEMFHLDEYIGLPEIHPASFRKYLKERFVNIVGLQKVYFVDGEGDITRNIAELTMELNKEPIDVALIGIGENAHIAFNDPPADFETTESFIIVNLDNNCKNQQVREGWFSTIEDVPNQAISMTVHQIMQSNVVISCVPYKSKADALRLTIENEVTNEIPATILKTHKNWMLFIEEESGSLLKKEDLAEYLS
ncbi:MAG: glucosamine-6-phosphate deaminase [Desulfitobacteriaceae bacterium]